MRNPLDIFSEKAVSMTGYGVFALVSLITYSLGLWVDVVDVDAAQYAAISMEMLQRNEFLQVFDRGADYLDKPPFLFWINCISYSLLGINNAAFKMPSVLFSFGTALYTYKLGKQLYNNQVGRWAAAVLVSMIGFVWINNDVKTDAILTSCILISTYHLVQFVEKQQLKFAIWAGIFTGIGMMTKGPIALVVPAAVVGFHLLCSNTLKRLMHPGWFVFVLLALCVLLPMCYGLYQQFDLHPEKVVGGRKAVSGLRFFFWEQSFGRITGENSWRNNTPALYLFHAFLFLIVPYCILAIRAVGLKVLYGLKRNQESEYYTFAGSFVVLCLLSMSQYKIPHYASVALPFMAILIVANWRPYESMAKAWLKWHNYTMVCLVFLSILATFILFAPAFWVVLCAIIMLLITILSFSRNLNYSLILSAMTFGFVANTHILPNVIRYSVGRKMADVMKEKGITEPIYFYNKDSQAFEFYAQRRMTKISFSEMLHRVKNRQKAWYFMDKSGLEQCVKDGLTLDVCHSVDQYDLTRIMPSFIDPRTRESALTPRLLVKFK